ncbi:MAG TPA: exodeoxyribonuclease VII small subunit [Nevskiaceae bacterium]
MARKRTVADDPAEAEKLADKEDPVGRFETDLKELEDIVQQMEAGDLPLEKTLRLFERGVHLSRSCRDSLATAELRIRELLPEAAPELSSTDADEAAGRDAAAGKTDEIPF